MRQVETAVLTTVSSRDHSSALNVPNLDGWIQESPKLRNCIRGSWKVIRSGMWSTFLCRLIKMSQKEVSTIIVEANIASSKETLERMKDRTAVKSSYNESVKDWRWKPCTERTCRGYVGGSTHLIAQIYATKQVPSVLCQRRTKFCLSNEKGGLLVTTPRAKRQKFQKIHVIHFRWYLTKETTSAIERSGKPFHYTMSSNFNPSFYRLISSARKIFEFYDPSSRGWRVQHLTRNILLKRGHKIRIYSLHLK